MPASPSVQNYQYGAGVVRLKVDGVDNSLRHVGNVKSLTISKELTTIEHKQTMSGLKSTDLEIITEVSGTINIELDEVTPENMALFVMGNPTATTGSGNEFGGLTLTTQTADFQYISDNPNGNEMEFNARVSIKPNGDFSFITDGLTSIPLTMKILQSGGAFGTWVFP